ncbi:hypothetical protein ACIQVE_22425 [Pseudomonas sp. NPDC098747]|uniref:hypothetical protein n=1 Tax=Pseudomonas sp. NPDC098747 TaxID=3364487 RepID=UPI00383A4488
MSVAKYTTENPSVLSLPLVALANPENLPHVLEFIAKFAPPCIAEGLISKMVADLVLLIGCTRKAALSLINQLILVFS